MGWVGRHRTATKPAVYDEDPREWLLRVSAIYDGADLFQTPPAPAVSAADAGKKGGARIVDLSFPSAYRPFHAPYREEHASYTANNTVRARWVRTSLAPRGTAIVVHGWKSGAYFAFDHMFPLKMLAREGYDYVLFQLPFHGQRAPIQAPQSGALFPSPNVLRTNETFGQVISDLRQLAIHLAANGAPNIGILGMSLGGYVAALWASLGDSLSFVIPMIPATDMASLMWAHGRGSRTRSQAENRGVTESTLRQAFTCHSPLERPVTVPKDRLCIVAGEGDRIAPPAQAHLLWEHWERPAIHWFPGGHLAQFGRRRAYAQMAHFLQALPR